MVEKEKDALEGEKNIAINFFTLENEIFREKESRLSILHVSTLIYQLSY